MKLKRIFSGRALYVSGDMIWVARGMTFFAIDKTGKALTKKYNAGGFAENLIGAFRLSRQLLRVGIHHLLPMADGGILVSIKKKMIKFDKQGKIEACFNDFLGNKPAHRGMCVTPDGTVFFGEYTMNMNRTNTTSVFRSRDFGKTFEKIKTFSPDEIRHIHFIQWDKYENCLWLGTGDENSECRLYKSTDSGDNWTLIGQGNQLWRAVGISCTKDFIYWGTDAGSVPDPNFIIKYSRSDSSIKEVLEVEGPCHGNAILGDSKVFVSTGVEGGQNEKDKFAHLYEMLSDGQFKEILKMQKDIFPLILQYGVMRFPMGLDNYNHLVFTAFGLKGNGEAVFISE